MLSLAPANGDRFGTGILAPPQARGARGGWDEHLEKLIGFWSSVMLTSGRYKGNPVAAHMKHLGKITPPMFDRWLSLWAEVTEDMLPATAAAALQSKATRIAESLKLALYFRIPTTLESPTDLAVAAP